MKIIDIILIGIGLAMDACAVAICKGLSMEKINMKKANIIALYFGIFQAIMPLIGYCMGANFAEVVRKIDHLIAFSLLSLIGINMIRESMNKNKKCKKEDDDVSFKSMIGLAIATSIDALVVGIGFAFIRVNILEAVLIIGVVTFMLSFVGVIIGNIFGDKLKDKAEILGGTLLILIGLKILLVHFNII